MERQAIYVDVLLALNFLCDYLLLSAAFALCRRDPKRARLALGAFIGALGSLIIFLPLRGAALRWGWQLLISALMCRAAEPWQGLKRFLGGWATLFAVSFLFGGAMLALRLTLGEGWMLVVNGVVYFHIHPLVLVGNMALGFGAVQLFQRLFPDKTAEQQPVSATLQVLGQSICCMALLDNGNHLTEPFSGWPVVVLERSLLPLTIPEEKRRLIPCGTVSGTTILQAVKGESLRWGDFVCERFYVALSEEPLRGGCQLLLSTALQNTK